VLELVESWTSSLSDPPLSEHTRHAIADGSAYVTIDQGRRALLTISPTSLVGVGLVELAGATTESALAHWDASKEDLMPEARRRGLHEIEVIDRGSTLGDAIGTPGRSIVRMKLSTRESEWGSGARGDAMPDLEELAELIRESFADHPENGGWTVRDVDTRMSEPWFDPDGFFTERVDGKLAGFCWTKVHDDGVGEIYLVAVGREFGGRGMGHRLLNRALGYLKEGRSCGTVIVYLEESNQPARRLYERSGFAVDRVDRRVRIEI